MAKRLTALAPIKKGDFTIRPFVNHKKYTIYSNRLADSGYTIKEGNYYKNPLPISSSKGVVRNAPKSSDDSYNYVNYESIKHLYYDSFSDQENTFDTFEGVNPFTTKKQLFTTASIISTPYFDRGEKIKPKSVIITSGSTTLYDDGFGNLYDSSIDSSSFISDYNLDMYVGFEDLHAVTLFGTRDNYSGIGSYKSGTHIPYKQLHYRNVNIKKGLLIDGSPCGNKVTFTNTSSVELGEFKQISYDKEKDFTLSFYLQAPLSQSNLNSTKNTLISKNRVASQDHYGIIRSYTQYDQLVERKILSSSIDIVDTKQYPYQVNIYNQSTVNSGKIEFRRGDGVNEISLASTVTVNDGLDHNICVTKSGSLISLYVDGDLQSTSTDVPGKVFNNHYTYIGASDRLGYNQYSGSFDELRLYDRAATATEVSNSLADNIHGRMFQTSNVGNVFYRQGFVVGTSLLNKYHNMLLNDWTMEYRNTHTTYEYEAIVKIKRGSFNGTMNPTAREAVNSQQLNLDFVTGSLTPYVTTIGLYDPSMNLLAVGKMGRALKIREDVDLNVVVRFDY